MPRIQLDFPEKEHFATMLRVRVTDLNYGNHLGNDAFVGLLHQARIEMLESFGISELNIGDNTSLIQGDLVVVYKTEGHLSDEIEFKLSVTDFGKSSFDVFYQATNKTKGKVLALAKTRMVCFDYEESKTCPVPKSFGELFD